MQVHDRWTGELLADVPLASPAEVDAATARAAAAFDVTRRTPGWQRRDALRKISAGLELRAEDFARTLARECGKPIVQARAEVARAVSTFLLASEEATRTGGGVLPLDVTPVATGYSGRWTRVPVGPVLGIAPFNFPLNLVAHKVAPALAVGASIVLKPPPQAPLTSLALAELVRTSGLPEDALQVVPCDVPEAERMVTDERFALLSFTGSDRVGWHLKSIAGKKRVLLELGGNAAAVVHEDAPDLAFAAQRIASGAFAYAGQVCIKVQRLYVHRPIAEAFVAEIATRTRSLEPRSPLDDAAVLGPMIDEAAAARVEVWTEEALAMGAKPLLRGTRTGNRLGPTILSWDGVGDGSGRGAKVVDEEVFGPVLTVHVYDDWDGALRLVDATRFGLQAGIFTDSVARVERAFEDLHVGGLVVGDVPTFRVDHMPYGGTRDSGLGREGVRFAMDEMTEPKLLVLRRGG
jgi:glyceraldehyde-3-phosphate dehydrogenase (NADP+)